MSTKVVVIIPFFIQYHSMEYAFDIYLLSVLCLVFNFPGCLIVAGILKLKINNWKNKATSEVEEADEAYRIAIRPINDAHAEIIRLIAQVEKTK